MTDNQGGLSCAQGSWGLALGSGIIAAALLMILGEWRLIQAIFACIVLTIIIGALLQWLVCRQLSAPGDVPLRNPNPRPVPTSKESAAAAASAARAGTEPMPATPAASAASAAKAGVKPSKSLAGQADLASRKGSWKYGADEASTSDTSTADITSAPAQPAAGFEPTEPAAAEPAAAEPAAAEPAAAEPATAEPVATEPEAATSAPSADAPERLDMAREGGPDDLKRIKGVGPKLERLLHSMGFFHFDQIASWTDKEVAWVDQNLEGFRGRVRRDNWVDQASTLASGGTTEFSERNNQGDD